MKFKLIFGVAWRAWRSVLYTEAILQSYSYKNAANVQENTHAEV